MRKVGIALALHWSFFIRRMEKGECVIVEKVINNNVILARNDEGQDVVVMGKGIGFQKKAGSKVLHKKIEKIFSLESRVQADQFAELVKKIPRDHLSVIIEIIDYARSCIARTISPSIYISLTDHLNFSLERMKKGWMFEHPLLNEVRTFYPNEYIVGEYALNLIEKRIGVKLPVDEAAAIALHLVNAEYHLDMGTALKLTNLVRESLQLVEETLHIKLDEKSLSCSRFITHLKFMIQRVLQDQMLDDEDELTMLIAEQYHEEFEISKLIGQFILENYEKQVTKDELAYMTIHIRRLNKDVQDV